MTNVDGDVDKLFSDGCARYEEGNRASAIECWRAAVIVNPNHVQSHYNIGVCLREQGQIEEALEEFHHVIKLSPNFVDGIESVGYIMYTRAVQSNTIDDWRAALYWYRRVAHLVSDDSQLYVTIGQIEQHLGYTTNAINSMCSAIQLNSTNDDAYFLLTKLYRKTRQWRKLWLSTWALVTLPNYDPSKYPVDPRRAFVFITKISAFIVVVALLIWTLRGKRSVRNRFKEHLFESPYLSDLDLTRVQDELRDLTL